MRPHSVDAVWIDADDSLINVVWVLTHIWPQEPPTAPKAVSADHRAACIVEVTATLNGRFVMPRAAVAA